MQLRALLCLVSLSGAAQPATGDPPLDSRTNVQKFWVGQLTVGCQRPVSSEARNETVCPAAEGSAVNCTGKYGNKSPVAFESGILVHVRAGSNQELTTGCYTFQNAPRFAKWIALIKRGDCKFDVKMQNAVRHNATAVVIYDHEDQDDLPLMSHEAYDMVSIIIPLDCGTKLASRLDDLAARGLYLETQIIPLYERDMLSGDNQNTDFQTFNRTSVLIVSITFIVLMVFSLGWLVFYYVQRFRFASMKDRLARQLADAAKRAIKRIPKRTVRPSDMSESNVCAVCIESYNSDDVIRELPCSHVFHKHCIDQWLIDKRVCPMCKLNILEALGIRVKGEHGTEEEEQRLTAMPVPASNAAEPASAAAAAAYQAEIEIVPARLQASYVVDDGRGRGEAVAFEHGAVAASIGC